MTYQNGLTQESRDQALALGIGLALARGAGKSIPIAAVTVLYPDGERKFCQYADSFCQFKQLDGNWEYAECTCTMQLPQQLPRIDQADQIVAFPDFYDRPVFFCRYGSETALFVGTTCQGFLTVEPSCECLHHHTPGGVEPPPPPQVPDRPPPSTPPSNRPGR